MCGPPGLDIVAAPSKAKRFSVSTKKIVLSSQLTSSSGRADAGSASQEQSLGPACIHLVHAVVSMRSLDAEMRVALSSSVNTAVTFVRNVATGSACDAPNQLCTDALDTDTLP